MVFLRAVLAIGIIRTQTKQINVVLKGRFSLFELYRGILTEELITERAGTVGLLRPGGV